MVILTPHPCDADTEFAVLGASINSMVDSLRSTSRKVKDDEIFQKEMITRLPVGIFIKTAEDGRYVFWNNACEEIFHLSASTGYWERPTGSYSLQITWSLLKKRTGTFSEPE